MTTKNVPAVDEIVRGFTPDTTASDVAIVLQGFGYARTRKIAMSEAQHLLDRHRARLRLFKVGDADTVIATSEHDARHVVMERHDLYWSEVEDEPVTAIGGDTFGMWWEAAIPSMLVPYVDKPYTPGPYFSGVHITAPVKLWATVMGRCFLASTEV